MTRIGGVGILGMVCAFGVMSCGDDDSSGGGGALSGKALESLTADDVEDLCSELIGIVRDASSPERQCVALALDTSESELECNELRTSCLRKEDYFDYDGARCKSWTRAPEFDCDTKVSEVKACYERVADWLDGLRCSEAGDAPEAPGCVAELVDDCKFGFNLLLAGDDEDVDAGSGDPGDEAMCRDGSEALSYDFGLGAECNACATESCCDSFVECQNDEECLCYWNCLNSGETECYEPCDITAFPPAFGDHAVCLSDNCGAPCGLD